MSFIFSACPKRSDVVIALDGSSGVGKENFHLMQSFGKHLAKALPVNREEHTRLGVLLFANTSYIKYHLRQYRINKDAVNAFRYLHGTLLILMF